MSKLDLADANESKSQGKNPKKKREARSASMQLNPYSSQTSNKVQDGSDTEEYWQLQMTHTDAYYLLTLIRRNNQSPADASIAEIH